jgi:hypothetical protein
MYGVLLSKGDDVVLTPTQPSRNSRLAGRCGMAVCSKRVVDLYDVSTCTMCRLIQYVDLYNVSTYTMCRLIQCVDLYNVSTYTMCRLIQCVDLYNVST